MIKLHIAAIDARDEYGNSVFVMESLDDIALNLRVNTAAQDTKELDVLIAAIRTAEQKLNTVI